MPDPNALRSLAPADHAAVTHILATAFHDDPLWCFLVPDEKQRYPLAARFFRPAAYYALRAGQVYGVGDPPEGVAVWGRPGAPPRLFGLRSLTVMLSPLFLPFLRIMPLVSRFETLHRKYAPDPHYYLAILAVAPQSQGKGLASRLVRPFLAEADADGKPVYLETNTPRNVSLYEHYGFRVMETVTLRGLGMELYAMVR
jgi:ribosomal protein S18 acetylase RimI-like enzyme